MLTNEDQRKTDTMTISECVDLTKMMRNINTDV